MASDFAATFAAAERLVGRDVIIRDDPCFGRAGRVKRVIPDETFGFLVLVDLYKPGKRGEFLDRPGIGARTYWQPGKIEVGR